MYTQTMETTYPRLSQALLTNEAGHLLVDHLLDKQRLLSTHNPAHEAIKQLPYNAAYLAAHQAAVGPSVFYDVLPNGGFINYRRPRSLMDLNLLADVFRSKKALDQNALRHSRSHLHIGMTNAETGQAEYLSLSDMREDFDVVNALIASSSVPGVTGVGRKIDGKQYSDGLSSCTDPITYAVNMLGATDILVVMNSPLGATTKLTILEKTINKIILRGFSPAFRQAHESRHTTNGLYADREYNPDITVGVLCPSDNLVSRASSNSRTLKEVADLATAQTISIFDGRSVYSK